MQSLSYSLTHTHKHTHSLLSLFFLFHTDMYFHFLSFLHTHTHIIIHSVPPYSPAPHRWAWGNSSDIWTSQPAASLNSTCQAEQKHPPPPSSDQWHSLLSFSLPSPTTSSSSNTTIPSMQPFLSMPGLFSVLYDVTQLLGSDWNLTSMFIFNCQILIKNVLISVLPIITVVTDA